MTTSSGEDAKRRIRHTFKYASSPTSHQTEMCACGLQLLRVARNSVHKFAGTPMKAIRLILPVLCVIAALSACQRERTSPLNPPPVPQILLVGPKSVVLFVGDTLVMSATYGGAFLRPDQVIWTSSDTTRATVTGTGLVRVVGNTPGVSICAARVLDPAVRACMTLVTFAKGTPLPPP